MNYDGLSTIFLDLVASTMLEELQISLSSFYGSVFLHRWVYLVCLVYMHLWWSTTETDCMRRNFWVVKNDPCLHPLSLCQFAKIRLSSACVSVVDLRSWSALVKINNFSYFILILLFALKRVKFSPSLTCFGIDQSIIPYQIINEKLLYVS